MEIVIIWLLFGVASAFIANSKGANGCLWFFVGILLGPFGILAALFAGGKECPFCRSRIHADATVCPKCQRELPAAVQTAPVPVIPTPINPEAPEHAAPRPPEKISIALIVFMWLAVVGTIGLIAFFAYYTEHNPEPAPEVESTPVPLQSPAPTPVNPAAQSTKPKPVQKAIAPTKPTVPTHPIIHPRTPVFQLTSSELIHAYRSSTADNDADVQYTGQYIAVSGTIEYIGDAFDSGKFLTMRSGGLFIRFDFSASNKGQVENLVIGQHITVSGKCRGRSMFISIVNCTVQ